MVTRRAHEWDRLEMWGRSVFWGPLVAGCSNKFTIDSFDLYFHLKENRFMWWWWLICETDQAVQVCLFNNCKISGAFQDTNTGETSVSYKLGAGWGVQRWTTGSHWAQQLKTWTASEATFVDCFSSLKPEVMMSFFTYLLTWFLLRHLGPPSPQETWSTSAHLKLDEKTSTSLSLSRTNATVSVVRSLCLEFVGSCGRFCRRTCLRLAPIFWSESLFSV